MNPIAIDGVVRLPKLQWGLTQLWISRCTFRALCKPLYLLGRVVLSPSVSRCPPAQGTVECLDMIGMNLCFRTNRRQGMLLLQPLNVPIPLRTLDFYRDV